MIVTPVLATRTDRLLRAVVAELESQRACIDAGTPLALISVTVHLHPDGKPRRVFVRIEAQSEAPTNGHRQRPS